MPKWLTILLSIFISIGLLLGAIIWLIRDDQIDKIEEIEEDELE